MNISLAIIAAQALDARAELGVALGELSRCVCAESAVVRVALPLPSLSSDGTEGIIESLMGIVNTDPALENRVRAIRRLGEYAGNGVYKDKVRPFISDCLNKQYEVELPIRRACIEETAREGVTMESWDFDRLIEWSGNKETSLASAAAHALGQTVRSINYNTRARAQLADILDDPRSAVKIAALQSLSQVYKDLYPDQKNKIQKMATLEEKDDAVRREAQEIVTRWPNS